MPQCPVCQTEYGLGQVNYCSTCGWDLTSYPPTLGQVPSAFLEKEQAKIAWAREIWAKSQAQLSEFQSKLQSQLEQLKQDREKLQSQISQAQFQLEKSEQERSCLQSQFEQVNARTLREAALTHIEEQMAQVLSRLQQMVDERSPDVFAALSHLEERLENIETQLQRVRNLLSQWIPNLTLQLAQELAHIPDKSWARVQIDKLLQSKLKQPQLEQPYRVAFLAAIKSALEINNQAQVEKLREYLTTIGDDNTITQVDALLNARRELKLRSIIKRDIDGDTLYDS